MKKYLLRFLSINLFLFVGSSYALEHVDFPKTIADVSFKDRVENLKEGYEPFKDAKSYYQIHVTQTENKDVQNPKPTINKSDVVNSDKAEQNNQKLGKQQGENKDATVQNLSSTTNKSNVGNGDSNDSDKNESVKNRLRIISSEEVQKRIKPNLATSKENNQDSKFSQVSELEGDKYNKPKINTESDKSREVPTIEADSVTPGVFVSADIPGLAGMVGDFSINMDCAGVREKFNTSQIEGFALCKDALGGSTGPNCWCNMKDPKSSVLKDVPAYAIKTFNSYGECSEKCTGSCNSLYEQELIKLCTDN